VTETVSQAIISGAIGIVLWAILYTGYNMWAKLYRLEGHIAQFVPLLYMGHVISPIISGAIGIVLWAILYMGYYVGQIVSP
jgi:hypothetical protein